MPTKDDDRPYTYDDKRLTEGQRQRSRSALKGLRTDAVQQRNKEDAARFGVFLDADNEDMARRGGMTKRKLARGGAMAKYAKGGAVPPKPPKAPKPPSPAKPPRVPNPSLKGPRAPKGVQPPKSR